ncbi:hypothetical protein [Streptomyces sp. H27-D2]|uniref:hypothetical protein n=1 Tax=Streptomyces sp. H27-D2 TaxID=3046304 RepID=UPI002DB69E4B|nr:hypothetical protein [Streptomyces sp. H27-D2]MEC4016243.1 hypothetical protein [Streptomyces sp. H27-D2]
MSGKLAKAKGFKKSRAGTYLSIGTSLFGVVGIAKRAKLARSDNDTLMMVDAVVSAAAIATSVALLYRELKRLGDDDVLLG